MSPDQPVQGSNQAAPPQRVVTQDAEGIFRYKGNRTGTVKENQKYGVLLVLLNDPVHT